jgi:predicted Zn-dependent peptidase
MAVRISTLANGLRVVTDPMPGLKTASVGVWVGAGARNETPEVNGIAHMLEHMAFKGTERRNARAIAEEIEAVGGHLNAYTSRENTAYFARVMAEDVDLALDIVADILQHSLFEPAELERERTVIVQEIAQTNDTPDDVIFDHLQAVAFPDQPLGRSILGTTERVTGMRREQLWEFMAAHYRPSAMVLGAAGAVEHEHVVNLAEKWFSGLRAAPAVAHDPARYGSGEYRAERDLDQAHLAIGFPGVAYDDPDYYAMQVYATLLGGGMSSRLFQEVRENRGLAYSVYSFTSSFSDSGLFAVYAGASGENMEPLVPVIGEEMAKTAQKVGEDEVARARAQLKVGLMMSLESSSSRVEQVGRQLLIFGRPISADEIAAAVDKVDAAAVIRCARRVLGAGAPVVAALGPVGRLEKYDRIAARFHP